MSECLPHYEASTQNLSAALMMHPQFQFLGLMAQALALEVIFVGLHQVFIYQVGRQPSQLLTLDRNLRLLLLTSGSVVAVWGVGFFPCHAVEWFPWLQG